jgi:hypothetical protein
MPLSFPLIPAVFRVLFFKPASKEHLSCHACANLQDLLAIPDLLAYGAGHACTSDTTTGASGTTATQKGLRAGK